MEIETARSSYAREQSCSANGDSWSDHQADTILVEEFYSGRRGKTLLLPEQRLMLAILEDALDSFQQHCAAKHGKRKQLFKSVERWFFAPGSGWVFDFESICSVLGFEPDYVRKGLAQWRGKELSKRPSSLLKNSDCRLKKISEARRAKNRRAEAYLAGTL